MQLVTDLIVDCNAGICVPPPSPVTRPGDLWQVGPHRILCGDPTDPTAVATLFARDEYCPYVAPEPGDPGSALLAAHRAGRAARVMEIAPAYVDVALKRFRQNFPGVPIHLESSHESFAEVAYWRTHPQGEE